MANKWKIRRVQYLATFSVSIATLTLGLSSGWPSPVIPKLMNNETSIYITKDEIAMMVSMGAPGFMVGSLLSRYVTDSFGRRITILSSAIPISLGTLIITFAVKAWHLYTTRFLWGVGTGIISNAVAIYVAEIADKEIRGSLFVYTRIMFNLGTFIMLVIGPFASYEALNYILLAVPMAYVCACWWIPESPYYRLEEGRVESARKVLIKLKGATSAALIEEELNSMRENVNKDMKSSTTAWELFSGRQYRRAVVITAGIKLFQIMTGTSFIQQYLGYIMHGSATNLSLATVLIVSGAVRFVVGILSSLLVDRVGRRPLIIYSYMGTAIAYTIVMIYFILEEVIKLDHNTLSTYSLVPFAGILISNVISTLGYLSVSYVIPSELFPMNVKVIAMTSNSIFAGCCGFITTILFQKVKDVTGFSGVFGLFAIVAFAGAVFCYVLVFETKGLSLNEIQVILQGESYKSDETDKLKDVDKKGNLTSYVRVPNDVDETLTKQEPRIDLI